MLRTKQYQRNLRYYGYYYRGNVDGKLGAKTVSAIRSYQISQGLKPTGKWDTSTNGASAKNVRAVQNKLGIKATGYMDSATVKKIKKWQKSKGYNTNAVLTLTQIKKMFPASSKSGSFKSKYFTLSEFKCGCGGRYCNGYPAGKTMNAKLLNILDGIRAHYGKSIVITCGQRCKKYNASLKGSIPNSLHLYGKAADIYVCGGICATAAGRNQVKSLAYKLGAKYSYCNTPGMGNAVHINV